MNRHIIASALITAILVVGLSFAWPLLNRPSNSATVIGILEPGVEAGCVILRGDDGTQYLLIGLTKYPPVGTRVSVTGYSDNNVANYCMQGETAIHVVSISTT